MKKQAYQKPTIYNSDGTKAQTGTFDIRTDPLTNSTADGILDYYNNNLEALKAQADDSANSVKPFILQPSTAYKVGDIVYSPTLGAGMYLECTTEGTTAATLPNLSSVKSGG